MVISSLSIKTIFDLSFKPKLFLLNNFPVTVVVRLLPRGRRALLLLLLVPAAAAPSTPAVAAVLRPAAIVLFLPWLLGLCCEIPWELFLNQFEFTKPSVQVILSLSNA